MVGLNVGVDISKAARWFSFKRYRFGSFTFPFTILKSIFDKPPVKSRTFVYVGERGGAVDGDGDGDDDDGSGDESHGTSQRWKHLDK
jgi:hypothetical protein